MLVVHAPRRLKVGLAGFAFQHPIAREAAHLDIVENALHLGFRLRRDDARAGLIFAKLGRVRNRVVHVGDAALVDQIDDELHFVQTFEVGHLRRVACFDQRFKAGTNEFDEATAQHGLLAEEIGLALFLEGRLDDARTPAPDG